jgi:hypothetical protein
VTTIKRVSKEEVRKAVSPGRPVEVAPVGTNPILKSAWPFANKMAHSFSKETMHDRFGQFLKNLVKQFR